MANNKKLYQAHYDQSTYELTSETRISEDLCWFVRNLDYPECSPLRELLGNYSLAIRGNTYTRDENDKIVLVEDTAMSTEDVMAMLFGLQYNGDNMSFEKDKLAAPFYSNRNLLIEIASRWHKGTIIWCEKAGHTAVSLVDYIKSATNPTVFVGTRQEIIVVSDETDRPGDIVVRMYPNF
jgi:hypothetical protein